MIWAGLECDDYSTWWELFAVFEEPERPGTRARAWESHCGENHEDEVNGKVHIRVQDVSDRRYGALLIELPPGNMERREDGLYCQFPPDYKSDVDGADRAASAELGTALAVAIGVPFEIESREGGHRDWRDILLEAAAEAGDASAQDELGIKLVNGVEKDYARALAWFHKAAEQGFASAEFNIGTLYSTGRGVTKDEGVATQWYRRAAEKGHWVAEFNMGVAYRNGDGVPTDKAEAMSW
jgi:Sel1 repeat